MQIHVEHDLAAQGRNEAHQGGRFLRCTAYAEVAIGIKRINIPALNALIGPGTHTRRDQ